MAKWFKMTADWCQGPYPTKRAAIADSDYRFAPKRSIYRSHAGEYEVRFCWPPSERGAFFWVLTEEWARLSGASVDHPERTPGNDGRDIDDWDDEDD